MFVTEGLDMATLSFHVDNAQSTALSSIKTADRNLQISHNFVESPETRNLYQIAIELKNTGVTPLSNIVYRRVVNFEIYPTVSAIIIILVASSILAGVSFIGGVFFVTPFHSFLSLCACFPPPPPRSALHEPTKKNFPAKLLKPKKNSSQEKSV